MDGGRSARCAGDLGAEQRMTASEVMALLACGETFCTVVRTADGKWQFKAEVVPDLRTISDGEPDDS